MKGIKKIFKANEKNQMIIDSYIRYYKAKKPNCSNETVRSKRQAFGKLADYLQKNTKHKSFKTANENNLIDFFNNKEYVTEGYHNLMGSHLIPFYRWLFDLDRFTRPENMKWFERTSERAKRRNNDPRRKEKLLMYPEEYKKIMDYSKDIYGQNKALWETYRYSGFRPEEVQSMNIEDVREDDDRIVWVSCPKSKTYPREIPLHYYPDNLIRYIGNHPMKNNKKAPLFFNLKGTTQLERLHIISIERRFREIRKALKLKETLVIKSFRKTRATELFGSDDPKINNDTHIGKYMGWQPNTVILRRQEYNLTNKDDLKAVIKDKPKVSLSYDTIRNNLEKVDNKYIPIIESQKKELNSIKKSYKDLEKVSNENREEYLQLKEEYLQLKNEMNKSMEEITNPEGAFYKNIINGITNSIQTQEVKSIVDRNFPKVMNAVKKMPKDKQLKIANEFIKKGVIPKEIEDMIE